MADREVVGIELVAKLDQLRAEFKSLPKTTDDETKQAVSLALKNLSRLEKGAAKSAKTASDSIGGKAGDGIKAFGEKAGDADTALKALAGAVGLVSPAAGAALSSIGDLAGGVEGASKATALMGVAGTAAAVGVVAVAASVAAFGAAAVGAVSASLDLAQGWKEIQGLGGLDSFQITSEQQASLEKGEAALTSIRLAGEAVVVAFASQVAPTVEEAAIGFTFLALGAGKIVSSFGEAGGVASDLATVLKGYLVGAFDAVAGGVARAIEGLAYLYDATGFDDLAASMRRGAEALRSYSSELDAKATEDQAAALSRLGEAAKATYDETTALVGISRVHNRTTRGSKDAAEEAKEAEEERRASLAALTADLKRAGDAQRETNRATEDAAKATSSLLEKSEAFGAEAPTAIEKTRAAYADLDRELLQQIETNAALGLSTEALESERVDLASRTKAEIASLEQVARDEKLAADQATADQAAEIQRAQQEAVLGGINSTIGALSSAFSAYSGLISSKYEETQDALTAAQEAGDEAHAASLEERGKRQKTALKALFFAEQGAALAQVAVDTALAISAVQAAWAAVPPVSIALTALAVGTGLAQAAAISAARPAFHSGGIVPGYGASQGTGEVSARLLPDEVVLNRQAVQGMGGPQAANSLNHGGGIGGSITLNQVWRGSTLDRVVYDVSRLPGSKTRQLTQGGRVGKRNR
ncbi:MAG: hypothetical protein E6Q97_38125 [Desulfurellales bacterium]|nr:MAG: hypothetical protein E6Q97_38125 [Desulfurellales bacterium]